MSRSRALACLVVALVALASPALAADLTLQNDGFAGGTAAYQGGFAIGEIAGSRFDPPGPFPMPLKEVLFLFGDTAVDRIVILHVWDDAAGTADPGSELYSSAYQVTGSSGGFVSIDLSAANVQVQGPFRVGIEFTESGLPSVARDTDGTINTTKNFIYAQGFGWVQSNLLGLTGDWVIRSVVQQNPAGFTVGGTVTGLNGTLVLRNNGADDLVINADGPFTFATGLSDGASYDVTVASGPASQSCVVSAGSGVIAGANVTDVVVTCTDVATGPTELKLDSFVAGGQAGFQGGFVAGEIAAVRLTPPGPTAIDAVRFLFGGAAGLRSVRLHVWEDAAGADAPGVELFAEDYLVDASDQALQEIDLSTSGLQVTGPFRVGIELYDPGLPSVARDDDGTIDAANNFVLADGIGWVKSSVLGLNGDWIIRAVIPGTSGGGGDGPAIDSIVDIGNDQGRQVRISFAAASQDQAGAATPVLQYEAFRRIDPLPGTAGRLAGWEFVGAIPAHAESAYSMVVPTLADSTIVDGMHWSVFFVRAATASPATYFDALPDSGYSVDNLAPGAPQNLAVQGDLLIWDASGAADFAKFSVYGSSGSVFDASATLIAHTVDPQLDVAAQPYAHFFVTATDFSGNEGAPGSLARATAAQAVPGLRRPLTLRPNPFNPATRVSFDLPGDGPVSVRVYDLRGREVDSVLDGVPLRAGMRELDYRSALPSGVYFMRVWSGTWSESSKFTIVK